MKASGLSGAELARRIDVHPNTVTGWTLERHKAPGAVLAYLKLLADVRRCAGLG